METAVIFIARMKGGGGGVKLNLFLWIMNQRNQLVDKYDSPV